MPRLRTVVVSVGASALLFAAVTVLALEGQEVAVLRTRTPEGAWRETRVWVADRDGSAWIELATPERDAYRDVLVDPRVEIVRDGRVHARVAEPHPGAEGHRLIRAALRARYGWADVWVGLLQDTSRSVAVRLRDAG